MKKISLLIPVILSLLTQAQDTVKIPQGVIYKTTTKSINNTAKKLIAAELSTDSTNYNLFDSILIVGPILWERYSSIPNIASIKGGNIALKMSFYDSEKQQKNTELVSAKLIQREQDYRKIIQQIINDTEGEPLIFRQLNELDLVYYWSVIFFDIEEPVFIVETNGRKFLFDINSNFKINWIDEVL